MNERYHRAVNATDHAIGQVEGLLYALDKMARDYDGTNNPDPGANAVMALINVMEEKVTDIITGRAAEWEALREGQA